MQEKTKDTPVLIVGCGPSGMTMALSLSQFGVKSTLLDRRETISESPRAHALNCRTLEILASLGVNIASLRAVATPDSESGWVRWIDTLVGKEFGTVPYERMDAPDKVPTPHPLFNIAQPAAEKVLLEVVQSDPNISIERGCQWVACEQRDTGVTSQLTYRNGEEATITSRFLIGADGAHSPVRESQGIDMVGTGVIQRFKNVHFRADLSHLVAHKPAILYWVLKQSCAGTLIAYDIRDNWVFMYPYLEETTDTASLTDEHCAALAREAIGEPGLTLEVLSIGDWEMSSEVASHYRSENIFLVGDAAHRYPPSGGLGLNTGVGDAHNLAWKMAAVMAGQASGTLLDTYHNERQPVAQNNANFSLENAVKMLDVFALAGVMDEPGTQPSLDEIQADSARWQALQASIEDQRVHFDGLALHLGAHYGTAEAPDPLASRVQCAEVGARLPHVWLQREGTRVSSLDLLSACGFTLFTPAQHAYALPAASAIVVRQLDTHFEGTSDAVEELGLARHAILVRPDGHIAALLSADDNLEQTLALVLDLGIAA